MKCFHFRAKGELAPLFHKPYTNCTYIIMHFARWLSTSPRLYIYMVHTKFKIWISNSISHGILNYSIAASLIPLSDYILFSLSNGPNHLLTITNRNPIHTTWNLEHLKIVRVLSQRDFYIPIDLISCV